MGCQAGTGDEHCCWIPGGGVCPHYDPNPPADAGGRCSLRHRLGSWAAVETSVEYAPQRAAFEAFAVKSGEPLVLCGDYPQGVCGTCGVTGG